MKLAMDNPTVVTEYLEKEYPVGRVYWPFEEGEVACSAGELIWCYIQSPSSRKMETNCGPLLSKGEEYR